jgi:hypothetical protein
MGLLRPWGFHAGREGGTSDADFVVPTQRLGKRPTGERSQDAYAAYMGLVRLWGFHAGQEGGRSDDDFTVRTKRIGREKRVRGGQDACAADSECTRLWGVHTQVKHAGQKIVGRSYSSMLRIRHASFGGEMQVHTESKILLHAGIHIEAPTDSHDEDRRLGSTIGREILLWRSQEQPQPQPNPEHLSARMFKGIGTMPAASVLHQLGTSRLRQNP